MLILGVDARGAHSAEEWVDVASLDKCVAYGIYIELCYQVHLIA